jgi:hypothetical protein
VLSNAPPSQNAFVQSPCAHGGEAAFEPPQVVESALKIKDF